MRANVRFNAVVPAAGFQGIDLFAAGQNFFWIQNYLITKIRGSLQFAIGAAVPSFAPWTLDFNTNVSSVPVPLASNPWNSGSPLKSGWFILTNAIRMYGTNQQSPQLDYSFEDYPILLDTNQQYQLLVIPDYAFAGTETLTIDIEIFYKEIPPFR